MLRNYFFTAWRSLKRHKIFSLINILGLSLGMAACLLILQYVRFERSYETVHEKADRIARITLDVYDNGVLQVQDAETYRTIGPMLKEEFPEVEDFVRMHQAGAQEFGHEGKTYKVEHAYMGDSSCFNIFSHHFLEGDPHTALTEPYHIVLTESIAQKIFGRTDVVGEFLDFPLERNKNGLEVVGVMEDVPAQTHLKFEVLVSYATGFAEFGWKVDAWNQNNDYTYVLLAEGTEYSVFEEKLAGLNEKLQQEELLEEEAFLAQPISEIHLYSNKTYEPEPNSNASTVYVLAIIAFFIIFIACVNYVNLTTARSMERAREIGIRKVVGSSRNQLFWQFMMEAMVINVIAALLAVSIFQLSLPTLRYLTAIPAHITFINTFSFWLWVMILMAISLLLSGFYPALVMTRFLPMRVLKGSFIRSNKGNWLRRGLITFQFVISVALIAGTVAIDRQIKYLSDKELGMDIDQTVVLEAPGTDSIKANFTSFRQEVLQYPFATDVALSMCVPGLSINSLSSTTGITPKGATEEHNYTFYVIFTDDNYIPAMEFEFLAGENFRSDMDAIRDTFQYVIVNEESLRLWGIDSPEEALGKKLDMWGSEPVILGVVKNFHQLSAKKPHIPMIICPTQLFLSYAVVNLSTDNMSQHLGTLQDTWYKHFPGSVFSYFFLDERYHEQYLADQRFFRLFRLLSGLAIFIACMGLVGMSTYTTLQRTKEIGIRKVLGASVGHIITLLTRSYASLMVVAIALAIPLSWWGINTWLEGYAYRMSISPWLFIIPVVLVLVITLLSVSWQTLSSARKNPIEALRYE